MQATLEWRIHHICSIKETKFKKQLKVKLDMYFNYFNPEFHHIFKKNYSKNKWFNRQYLLSLHW